MDINKILDDHEVRSKFAIVLKEAQDVINETDPVKKEIETREFMAAILEVGLVVASYAARQTNNPFDDIAVNTLRYSGLAMALLDYVDDMPME